jgi:hypothetical protein
VSRIAQLPRGIMFSLMLSSQQRKTGGQKGL